MRYRYYEGLSPKYARHIYVWVLNGERGTEYVTGENASPPRGRHREIVALIGPIAYVEGQGLEPYKDQLAEIIKYEEEDAQEKRQAERLAAMVQREVERRIPPPAEPESPENGEAKP